MLLFFFSTKTSKDKKFYSIFFKNCPVQSEALVALLRVRNTPQNTSYKIKSCGTGCCFGATARQCVAQRSP